MKLTIPQNGMSQFPYLSAIVGFASSSNDLSSGSDNYAYIGGDSAACKYTSSCASRL